MARTSKLSIQWAALLIASVILASAIPALPMMERGNPLEVDVAQTEDSGAISVFVTDDVGRLMAGADVTIEELDLVKTTNSTGFALFDHVPTDVNWTQYSVVAEKPGYRPSGVADVIVSPWNTTYKTLEVVGGILYGVVQDSIGPISGATISMLPLGYSNTTDKDGVYTVHGVPINIDFAVTASASGYSNQTKEAVLGDDYFEVLYFTMVSLTGAISGTVRHAATNEPLFNASVSVRVGAVTWLAMSDSGGEYRIPDLPSGNYTVTASLYGYESTSVSNVIVWNGSETESVNLYLVEKPTKIYGIVRAGTFLVPGVLISILDTDLFATTSVNGSYEITNITAGTYSLTASLEGYSSVTVVGIVIPRGGEVQVNINMESLPGPSLSGLVVSSKTNQPLSGVNVVVLGLATQRNTITNIDGQFIVTGLTGGNYTVRFSIDGYQPMELGPVVVPVEGSATLERVVMEPTSESFGGFIFGFDLAHSMMILALFLTIIILALAVLLRIRAFESPDKSPAIYDQEGEEETGDEKRPEPARDKNRQLKKRDKKRS